MNRLNGTEDGYSLRSGPTKKLLDAKASMLLFIDRMNDENFVISVEEMHLLAHADSAIDELLNVYHKIVLSVDG